MRFKSWKRGLVITVLAAGIVSGVWMRASAGTSSKQHEMRRVEKIHLDPSQCILTWTVSRGEMRDGQYVPKGKGDTYQIAFHKAEMTHNGVTYKFSEQEAVSVHKVMLLVSRYAAESVDWFEQRQAPVEKAER
jgi:hypothetical protein